MPRDAPVQIGQHFGAVLRRRRFGRFVLSQVSYPPGLRTPPHAHEAPAFLTVLNGSLVQRFRRREVPYRASSVLFRPARAEHEDEVSAEGAACFIFEPDPAWLGGTGLDSLSGAFASAQCGSRVKWLFGQLFREFRRPDDFTALAVEGFGLALVAEFSRSCRPGRGRFVPPWLDRAKKRLEANVTRRLTLSDLAARAGVHPIHLAASFRRAFGVSVAEYARAQRVDAARRPLRDTTRSISDIAFSFGFSSQSHFARVFRRQTGLTPLEYRWLRGRP